MKHASLRGSDLHSPTNELVENFTGSSIAALVCVKYVGIGVYPRIAAATAANDVIRGITNTAISNTASGVITSLGFLFNVNTQSFNVGDKLYSSLTGALSLTPFGLPVAYVLKKHASEGVLYVANTGVSIDDVSAAGFPTDAELEMTWAVAFPKPYKEFSYNLTGDIVDFDVYANDTKAVHVFNKHFTYDLSGNLIQIVTTNLITSESKTKDIDYDLAGEMISMTES